jgi:hypothetical protein
MPYPDANRGNQSRQLMPTRVDHPQFTADRERFLTLLQGQGLDVRLYDSAFNPYPFGVTPERIGELCALQGSIHRAIIAIVTNFARDPRLSAVIRLPANEQELLARLARRPYRVGSFRPDFLHGADGYEKITEINARFTLNAVLSSALLNRCTPLLDRRFAPLPSPAELEGALRNRLGESGPIGILKAAERGYDIHVLRAIWGERCEMVSPRALTEHHLARWRSVILELQQQEFFGEVSPGLLGRLAAHPGVLNDLRTVFIAHDKRLLSLLSTADLLQDYLEPDDVARLRRHVVPTWVKGRAQAKVREAMARPAGWLAKPPRSGKGKGIVVSSQLAPAQWRHTLNELPDDWVLQPYVEQKTFLITTLHEGDLVTVAMNVVGVLPGLDDHAFGPGMYRASQDAVVNVARGGIILAPALIGGSHVFAERTAASRRPASLVSGGSRG